MAESSGQKLEVSERFLQKMVYSKQEKVEQLIVGCFEKRLSLKFRLF